MRLATHNSRLALALTLIAVTAHAQPHRTWAALGLGVEQSARHNPAESPYTYAGFGVDVDAIVAREREASDGDAAASYSAATLHSDTSNGAGPSTAWSAATFELHYGRTLGARTAHVRWLLGGAFAFRVEDSRRWYLDPARSTDEYGLYTLGIGPYLRTEVPIRRTRLTNDLALPVASWVDYPYSNVAEGGQNVRLRFASLNALRVFDDVFRYRAGRAVRGRHDARRPRVAAHPRAPRRVDVPAAASPGIRRLQADVRGRGHEPRRRRARRAARARDRARCVREVASARGERTAATDLGYVDSK